MSQAREIPSAIKARLLEWYTPEEAEMWWTSPQPLLGGKRACDEPDNESLRLLDQLDSGAYL